MVFALGSFAQERQKEADDLGQLFGYSLNPTSPGMAPPAPPVAPQGATGQAPVSPSPIDPAATAYPAPGIPAQGPIPTPRGEEMWPQVRAGIFAGESGGDYNALYGYSNREGGRYSGVNLTNMTVDDAIKFSDPDGDYGQWVKGQVGRVATPMGAYQIVGRTLRGLKDQLGLKGDEKMTPELQDMLGKQLWKTGGTEQWEGYQGPGDPNAYSVSTQNNPSNEFFTDDEEPEQRGMWDSLKAFFRGEPAPELAELDWASGLQSLGIGLGQMSRGQAVDTSEVTRRQDKRRERELEEYKEERARQAAAQYASEQGDTAAAEAIMGGGMSLSDYMTAEQQEWARSRAEEQDAKSEAGQAALFSYATETLGLDPNAAQAFAMEPGAYASGETLRAAQDAVARANKEELDSVKGIRDFYSNEEYSDDPVAQDILSAIDNGASFASLNSYFDLTSAKEAREAKQREAELEERRVGATERSTDASISQGAENLAIDRQRLGQQEQQFDLSHQLQTRLATNQEAQTAASISQGAESNALAREKFNYEVTEADRVAQRAAMARQTMVETLAANPATRFAAEIAASNPDLDAAAITDLASLGQTNDTRNYQAYLQNSQERGVEPVSFQDYTNAQNVRVGGGETALERTIGTKVGEQVVEWQATRADAAASLANLQQAVNLLENGDVKTGALQGQVSLYAPSLVPLIQNADTKTAQQLVEQVATAAITDILGAQFTQVEGERIAQRAYDPTLSPQQNLARVNLLFGKLRAAAGTKDKMLETVAVGGGSALDALREGGMGSTEALANDLHSSFDALDQEQGVKTRRDAPRGATGGTAGPAKVNWRIVE